MGQDALKCAEFGAASTDTVMTEHTANLGFVAFSPRPYSPHAVSRYSRHHAISLQSENGRVLPVLPHNGRTIRGAFDPTRK